MFQNDKIHFILLPVVAALAVCSCKPTPRTALEERQKSQQTEETTASDRQVSDKVPSSAKGGTTELEKAEHVKVGLLNVRSTRQAYNYIRPWEKQDTETEVCSGVYIGNGQVLTVGEVAQDAIYVELSLPDQSRTVPAKVVKFDEDLNLALLTVQHEKDADIFNSLPALEIGEPMRLGSVAMLRSLTDGLIPFATPMKVESAESSLVPIYTMRSGTPLPKDVDAGLPLLHGDKLVGLVMDCNREGQAVMCINAELIRRFLVEDAEHAGVPSLGLAFADLDDPVFNRYLKLEPRQGGLYVSKVAPLSAAEAAGIRDGDVLVSVEGMPLDNHGRCQHPIYGLLEVPGVIRSLKPLGEKLRMGISRNGEYREITVDLNRDNMEKSPIPEERANKAPRYIMWGGLLFQPLTENYLDELRGEGNGGLPLPFLKVKEKVKEIIKEGRREVVALTLVIPTPATLGYDSLGFCTVEKVNDKAVQSFARLAELLDEPTPDGITKISINHPPYEIYLDRKSVDAANDVLRRRSIHQLRRMQ